MTSHEPTSEDISRPGSLPAVGPDTLSEVLRTVRLTGALFFVFEGSAPWLLEAPEATAFGPIVLPGAQQLVAYHIVAEGDCWGGIFGQPTLRLEAGDILLVPHGDPHFISGTQGQPTRKPVEQTLGFFREMVAGRLPFLVSQEGGGRRRARIVCGFLGCDLQPFNPLLLALPRFVRLRRSTSLVSDRLSHLIDLALAESRDRRPGGQGVLLRLSEVMFVEVIRQCLETFPAESGWLAGLQDPIVGRALVLLHERPGDPWTLESLAKAVGISRSTMADRFAHLVGQPPMSYLTHWRMQLAARLLSDGSAKVHSVAEEVGYDSEAAFSRAFKRLVGHSPALWRRGRPRPKADGRP